MAYESLLDKIRKNQSVKCPDCGSTSMKFMQHLQMYGGYVCSGCGTIWSADDSRIKEQTRRVF